MWVWERYWEREREIGRSNTHTESFQPQFIFLIKNERERERENSKKIEKNTDAPLIAVDLVRYSRSQIQKRRDQRLTRLTVRQTFQGKRKRCLTTTHIQLSLSLSLTLPNLDPIQSQKDFIFMKPSYWSVYHSWIHYARVVGGGGGGGGVCVCVRGLMIIQH